MKSDYRPASASHSIDTLFLSSFNIKIYYHIQMYTIDCVSLFYYFFQYKIWFNYSSDFMHLLLWFLNCGLKCEFKKLLDSRKNTQSVCGNSNTTNHIMVVAHSMGVMCVRIESVCVLCIASNLSFLTKLVNPLKYTWNSNTNGLVNGRLLFVGARLEKEKECSTIKWHGNIPHWTAINTHSHTQLNV